MWMWGSTSKAGCRVAATHHFDLLQPREYSMSLDRLDDWMVVSRMGFAQYCILLNHLRSSWRPQERTKRQHMCSVRWLIFGGRWRLSDEAVDFNRSPQLAGWWHPDWSRVTIFPRLITIFPDWSWVSETFSSCLHQRFSVFFLACLGTICGPTCDPLQVHGPSYFKHWEQVQETKFHCDSEVFVFKTTTYVL